MTDREFFISPEEKAEIEFCANGVTQEDMDAIFSYLCDVPPPGWWCSRDKGHDGPCAARPIRELNPQLVDIVFSDIDFSAIPTPIWSTDT